VLVTSQEDLEIIPLYRPQKQIGVDKLQRDKNNYYFRYIFRVKYEYKHIRGKNLRDCSNVAQNPFREKMLILNLLADKIIQVTEAVHLLKNHRLCSGKARPLNNLQFAINSGILSQRQNTSIRRKYYLIFTNMQEKLCMSQFAKKKL